jgi:hypothetical protein
MANDGKLIGWWLDLILFPALAIFAGVATYGFYPRRRAGADQS